MGRSGGLARAGKEPRRAVAAHQRLRHGAGPRRYRVDDLGAADRAGAGAARDIRARGARRPGAAWQRSVSRPPSRARAPGGNSTAAPLGAAELGGHPRAVPPRGAVAAGPASFGHPGS